MKLIRICSLGLELAAAALGWWMFGWRGLLLVLVLLWRANLAPSLYTSKRWQRTLQDIVEQRRRTGERT